MDKENLKSGLIFSTEKRAENYIKTGKLDGDFWYAYERAIDNDRLVKVCALILCDYPKGDIRQALEDAMFSESFMDKEMDYFESSRIDDGKARYYEEKYGEQL